MAFEKNWRQKRVIHRTPGGKMTRVKISSLPAEEQQKYNPNRYKRLGGDMSLTPSQYEELQKMNINPKHIFDMYTGVDEQDELDFEGMEEDEIPSVIMTNDASIVKDLFGDKEIVTVKNVPINAITEIAEYTGDEDLDSLEFSKFGDADDEEDEDDEDNEDTEFEEIKFGDSNVYKVDLGPYKDIIEVVFPEDKYSEIGIDEGFYNFYYRR